MNKILPQKRIHSGYSVPLFFIFLLLFLSYEYAPARDLSDQAKQKKIKEMYDEYKAKDFPYVPDITVAGLKKLQKSSKVILVDVRSAGEQKVSMIPSAITAEEFEKNAERYKDYIIVAYCTIGYRSGKYVKELRKKGFNAFNLMGGVLSWAHAGQKFASSTGDSLRVHVYGKNGTLSRKVIKQSGNIFQIANFFELPNALSRCFPRIDLKWIQNSISYRFFKTGN